jgi:DNA-binding transcriptional ArsR family regulator
VDALTNARRIAIDIDEMKEGRISDGYLGVSDIVAITKAERKWAERHSFRMHNDFPKEEADAFHLNLLRGVLGPEPGKPFSLADVVQAEALLTAEDRARNILDSAGIISASELREKEFPPAREIVPRILYEGVGFLAGPPKGLKSWLCLGGLCVPVATGGLALGRIAVQKGQCLYISLEDSPHRLQTRLELIAGGFPPLLDLMTDLPKGVSLADFLEAYFIQHEDTRLVVVDTLGRALHSDLNDYSETTACLAPIQRLALKHHACVLLVHHVKKGPSGDDAFDHSLGSQGILGAMDTALVMKRTRGENTAVLSIVGRDVQDASYSLELDEAHMTWRMTNVPPEETKTGPERREILSILKASSTPLKTGEIAKAIGRTASTASEHLKALEMAGIARSPRYGYWTYLGATESAESAESHKPEPFGSSEASLPLSEDSALSVKPYSETEWPSKRKKGGDVEGATWEDLGSESEPGESEPSLLESALEAFR